MKLKTVTIDGKTYAEVQDDKPLYTDDKGADIAFDAVATTQTISSLRGEAMRHRQDGEAAAKALKAFEGITDPAAALKALETVKNLDEKKLVDAGERDAAIAAAVKAKDDEYRPVVEERDGLKTALFSEKVGGAFARSKYIADNLILPPDIAETYFGKHFKVENGKTVAYDAAGNLIYAKGNPGTPADFDEAIAALVEQYPRKDSILQGKVGGGGGAQNPGGAGGNGGKTISRADFDKLSPSEQMEKATGGFSITE